MTLYQVCLLTRDLRAALDLLQADEPAIESGILYQSGTHEALPNLMVPIADRPSPGALHFVGFTDDRYWNAIKVFGKPDFVHRVWDHRAKAEIVDDDLCVFAKGDPGHPSPYTYDDSNQKDDPAYAERGSSPAPRVDR